MLYDWLKVLHIVAAAVWVGGGFVLLFIARRVRSSGDERAMADFARTLGYVGPRVFAPAVVGVLVLGTALVFVTNSWSFGQTWIVLAIGLFVVAFLIGAVYLGRIGIALSRVDERSTLMRLLDRWIVGYEAVLVVLFVIVWDMVVKPGI